RSPRSSVIRTVSPVTWTSPSLKASIDERASERSATSAAAGTAESSPCGPPPAPTYVLQKPIGRGRSRTVIRTHIEPLSRAGALSRTANAACDPAIGAATARAEPPDGSPTAGADPGRSCCGGKADVTGANGAVVRLRCWWAATARNARATGGERPPTDSGASSGRGWRAALALRRVPGGGSTGRPRIDSI